MLAARFRRNKPKNQTMHIAHTLATLALELVSNLALFVEKVVGVADLAARDE